jgi:hypothetical protein
MLFTVFLLADFKRKLDSTLFFVVKIHTIQKIRESRKLESTSEQYLVERKNEGRKPDNSLSLKRLKFMPRNLE